MLCLKVLGDPVLMGPSGPVTGRAAYKRRIALLAVLAVARGRPVGRERIIALLWPEHASDAARHTLSESLYVLRKELGAGLFVSVGDEIGLSPEVVASDVAAFEEALEAGRLEDAVDEYHGPLLDGFYVSDAPEFERWVDGERDRLARACAGALERLATDAEAEGRRMDAVEWWRRAAAHDPYSSRVALRLVQSLDAAGERATALRAAAAHASRMREELGVEPDSALTAFVERLRAEQPRPAAPSSAHPLPPSYGNADRLASLADPAAPAGSVSSGVPAASAGFAAPAEAPASADLPASAGPAPSTRIAASADASASVEASATAGAAPPAQTAATDQSAASTASSQSQASAAPVQSAASAGSAEAPASIDRPASTGSAGPAGAPGPAEASPSTESAALAGTPAAARASSHDPAPGSPPAAPVSPAPRRRQYAIVALAAALAVVLALVLVRGTERSEPEPMRYDPRRIAVLYFDDDSRGGELGYLANSLTGTLIDELSQVPALDVISRNGVKAYRDGSVGFDSMVAGLRVGSVVEGSVQGSGDSVRVTVQLVDTNRKVHLESRTIIRPLGDLFSLERAVGEEVAGFLRRRLGAEVRMGQKAAETRSPEALSLMLRAEQLREDAVRLIRRRHPLDAGSAGTLLQRADSLLARAEAADRAWVRPSVQRGLIAIDRSALASGPERQRLVRRAAEHARGALAREPRHAGALELRGRALWQSAGEAADTSDVAARLELAERDLRAAVEADSARASAWAALSQLLRLRGRFAESDLAARRALEQDAWLEDADDILRRLYFGAMAQGDYAAAGQSCAQGHAQFPGDWRFVECGLTLLREDPSLRPDPSRAWALVAELDRLDPPSRAREEGRAYSPIFRRVAAAAVLARAGASDSARAVLARARAAASGDPELRVPYLFDAAYVTLLLGDRQGARRLLDEYLAARPALRPYVARDVLFRDLFAPASAVSR